MFVLLVISASADPKKIDRRLPPQLVIDERSRDGLDALYRRSVLSDIGNHINMKCSSALSINPSTLSL